MKHTINEIAEHLNSLVAHLSAIRVDDFGDLHAQVRAAVADYLSEIGFIYRTWYITPKHDFQSVYFDLQIDFDNDKRSKFMRRGTLNRAFFQFPSEFNGMTLQQAIEINAYKKRAKELETLNQYITEQESKLMEAKERRTELLKLNREPFEQFIQKITA